MNSIKKTTNNDGISYIDPELRKYLNESEEKELKNTEKIYEDDLLSLIEAEAAYQTAVKKKEDSKKRCSDAYTTARSKANGRKERLRIKKMRESVVTIEDILEKRDQGFKVYFQPGMLGTEEENIHDYYLTFGKRKKKYSSQPGIWERDYVQMNGTEEERLFGKCWTKN
jgi:hypothetical protein